MTRSTILGAAAVLAVLMGTLPVQAQGNLDFDRDGEGQQPGVWRGPIGAARISHASCKRGPGCVFIREEIEQEFDAALYRGRVVTLSAWLKPASSGGSPELSLVIHTPGLPSVTYTATADPASRKWQKSTLVTYIHDQATALELSLTGPGFVDDIVLTRASPPAAGVAQRRLPQAIREGYARIDRAVSSNAFQDVAAVVLARQHPASGTFGIPFDSRLTGFAPLLASGARLEAQTSITALEDLTSTYAFVRSHTRLRRWTSDAEYVYELDYRDLWLPTEGGWRLIDVSPVAVASPPRGAVSVEAGPWRAGLPCNVGVNTRREYPRGGLGATDYDVWVPARDTLSAAVLFVDFADERSNERTETIYDELFPPLVRWIRQASSGTVSLEVTPVHHWYTLKNTGTYSFWRNEGTTRPLLTDLVAAAAADVPGLAGYDVVFVVSSRNPQLSLTGVGKKFITGATTLVGGNGIRTPGGGELRHVVTLGRSVSESVDNFYKTLLHETGHLFGLPDLYSDSEADTDWDMMGSYVRGSHLTAWSAAKLGWIRHEQVACVDGDAHEYVLTPVAAAGGTKLLVVPAGGGVYYAVELREWTGVDSTLCEEGVLIYRVDTQAKNDRPHMRVEPERTTFTEADVRCRRAFGATLRPEPGRARFSNDVLSIELVSATLGRYTVRVSPKRAGP